jgi:hypothetical protein
MTVNCEKHQHETGSTVKPPNGTDKILGESLHPRLWVDDVERIDH